MREVTKIENTAEVSAVVVTAVVLTEPERRKCSACRGSSRKSVASVVESKVLLVMSRQ